VETGGVAATFAPAGCFPLAVGVAIVTARGREGRGTGLS
jgi:hypothetical protein